MSVHKKRVAAAVVLLLAEEEKEKKKRLWVRQWIAKRQQNSGFFRDLMVELKEGDQSAYENFLRMSYSNFHALLGMVTPIIQKRDTHLRQSIPAAERLAVTLRFLATGMHNNFFLIRIRFENYILLKSRKLIVFLIYRR